MWGDIAIAFLLAFITAFMMTPYSIKLAKKVGAVDVPKDNRRMHHKPIPKLGGVAVIAGFVVSFIYLVITLSIEDSSRLNLFGIEEYGKKILVFFVFILLNSFILWSFFKKKTTTSTELGLQSILD